MMSYIRVELTFISTILIFNKEDAKSTRPKVMICDDDKELLRLFQLALEPMYDVLQASSGKMSGQI